MKNKDLKKQYEEYQNYLSDKNIPIRSEENLFCHFTEIIEYQNKRIQKLEEDLEQLLWKLDIKITNQYGE